jgi:RNA polymerase sigma-70 factor (ECF subfamily)
MIVTEMDRQAASNPGEAGANDDGALEAAFAQYQSELLGTLFYLVGNLEDARDAFQEAFIKCWRKRETLHEINNLKAWIFRVALNAGRDLRETAWRRKRQSMPEGEEMITSTSASAETQVEQNERLRMVRQALCNLRPEEQEVFLLRQNGDMTYEEIAKAIGIPTGTVKTRMRLAITKLRKVFATA